MNSCNQMILKVSSAFLLISLQAFASEQLIGVIAKAVGEVTVDGKPAKIGVPLHVGSTVLTDDGKVTILLGSEAVVHLGLDTELRITEFNQSEDGKINNASLNILHGKIRTLLKSGGGVKNFKIYAKNRVMELQGTQVLLDNPRDNNQPTLFATLEGKALIRDQTTRPGQQSNPIELSNNQAYYGAALVLGGGTAGAVAAQQAQQAHQAQQAQQVTSSISGQGIDQINASTAIALAAGIGVPVPGMGPTQFALGAGSPLLGLNPQGPQIIPVDPVKDGGVSAATGGSGSSGGPQASVQITLTSKRQ